MSVTTINLEMDTEQMRKIFGMQDAYIKKLEQDFQVTIVDRNGSIIITGEEENTGKASRVLRQLTALSDRGNDIEEQNVDYAIEMGREDRKTDSWKWMPTVSVIRSTVNPSNSRHWDRKPMWMRSARI